ncbi:methylitaconate delta2-delta3-isomerase [Streptomyces davaonensis JCM 4913]|uniref:Methylitaconate delta2-delta3-isomerase n=1 Tax=Streptomyces davaonensis (strain DSM 101723 / JCM 4913 / KCC S-0913 / 768) TaxID=1214101 RepID=K4QT93_STRDJ|nr:PrpF domain-containing protein [Streptomyces davaonensis]CCK26001.1 methylitaconate delta2-delta3-isomerase [Streptomyces davaonensis JCM 4913]
MHVPATLVRGGTSKCWLFAQVHMPADRDRIERVLVDAYGATDPVQLDGVGGATPTTSKAAVVGPSARDGVDIDYLFAQVGIGTGTVEWGSNCGNCATAIALYAVAEGLVPIKGDRTCVVMRNTNTGAVLEAEVDTPGGRVQEFGDRTVPGTLAGGVPVGLTFRSPAGAATGRLLPTGLPSEQLPVGERSAAVSMVDAGAPVALVDAAHTGRTGAETLEQLREEVTWLRKVRQAAAIRMGLAAPGAVPVDAVPKVGLVGPPVPYTTTLGEAVAADAYDVSVRMLSMNSPHPAIGLTSAVAMAAANLVEGTVVAQASTAAGRGVLRIGTPAGVLTVESFGPGPDRVTVARAARVLCQARILVRDPALPAAA